MGTNRNYKANRMESVFMQNNLGDWLQEASQRAMSSSKKDRNRGASYSAKEVAEKQYARMETEDERQYQQEFYDRNYSFQGQVNQMQQAGLNPSLMYGQMGSTASSGSSADTISAPADSQQEDSPLSQFDSVVGMLSSMIGLGTDAATLSNTMEDSRSKRTVEKEQARGLKLDNYKKEVDNATYLYEHAIDLLLKDEKLSQEEANTLLLNWQVELSKSKDPKKFAELEIQKLNDEHNESVERVKDSKQSRRESRQNVKESQARIELMNTEKNLNNKQIEKLASDIGLNNAEIDKITQDIETSKSQKSLNEQTIENLKDEKKFIVAHAKWQNAVAEDAELRRDLLKYAKENDLPVDDYMAISIYQYIEKHGNKYDLKRFRGVMEDLHRKHSSLKFGDIESIPLVSSGAR